MRRYEPESAEVWQFCAGGQDKAMVPLGPHLVVCTSFSGVQRRRVAVQRWHNG